MIKDRRERVIISIIQTCMAFDALFKGAVEEVCKKKHWEIPSDLEYFNLQMKALDNIEKSR